jgi:diadenosine tetraphosphate (Ap4A) HIT family hydrolase
MTTAIHRHVDEARAGGARVIARLRSGWAVMGESQVLPGYCLLLPDPVVGSLNDLSFEGRAVYLEEMAMLGDAVVRASAVRPRRINYEILGNLEPALHAHVIPRFESEPADLRTKAVWMYPPEVWNAPEHRFDVSNPVHLAVREALKRAVEQLQAEACDRVRHSGLSTDGDADTGSTTLGADTEHRGTVHAGFSVSGPGLFQRACAFAARAHDGHRRKDGRTPYISHPFRVAMIVRDVFGCTDQETLAAAVLHDTLEDTRTDFDDLAEAFGVGVASLVVSLSKDKRIPEPERERAYDEGLSRADWRARLIKLADVLDNKDDPWRPSGDLWEAEAKRVAGERVRRALAIATPLWGKHASLDRAIAVLSKVPGAG